MSTKPTPGTGTYELTRRILEDIERASFAMRMRLPRSQPIDFPLNLGGELARALSPLPSDRELPFAINSQAQARMMTIQRRDAARIVAEHIANALLKAFEDRDPIMGYSPEEWAQMNRQ